MTAVLGREPFVTKTTLILFCALIYAAGCGGGGSGGGSGGSGSTGFAGGYYRFKKKRRNCLRVPTITLTVIQTHKKAHLIRLHQSVLSARHTLISFPHWKQHWSSENACTRSSYCHVHSIRGILAAELPSLEAYSTVHSLFALTSKSFTSHAIKGMNSLTAAFFHHNQILLRFFCRLIF